MSADRRDSPKGSPGSPGSEVRIDLEGPRERFPVPRLLLLAFVVLGTIWAYSWHFEHVAERFNRQDPISDETGTLSPERLRLLREAASILRKTYGVALVIKVRRGPVAPPPGDAETLFIGLDTAGATSVVVLPPLLARALPEELASALQNGYFAPYFATGAWPEGLYSAVLAILEALRDRH